MKEKTDANLKIFAMFHTRDGLRLTPAYDLVASALYPEFWSVALSVSRIKNLDIRKMKPKHWFGIGNGFGLREEAIVAAIEDLGRHLPAALEALSQTDVGSPTLRDKLVQFMEKRWNGSFKSTGQALSKRR